ncbi:MAG: YitT family protein [Clostridium sp.]|nr:YitT family protein [Clostridium sp.]
MKQVKEILILSAGVFIISAAVFFFLVPSHCSVSSISGLAILLTNVLPFSVSQITMALNVALLLVGFLTCGREFGAKTVYTSILLPLFIGLFEKLLPDYTSLTGDMTLDVICYIFTVSVGLAILFNRNASSGGLDIVAKVMNKYLHIELGKAMSAAGMCIALSSAFFYDSKTVVLSVLGTYLNGIVLDHFIFDQSVKRRVCIVSEKSEEIRNFILKELHSGASVYRCIGALRMNEQEEIITIVSKTEYQQLMNYLQKTDPTAFVTVYKVNDMRYIPKDPDYGNDA